MKNKILKINAVGLDDQSLRIIDFFIQRFCSNNCLLVEEVNAEAFIINMDHHKSNDNYRRTMMQYPDAPIILLALRPITSTPHYFLQKPLIVNQFLDILNSIEQELLSQKTSTSTPNNLSTLNTKVDNTLDPLITSSSHAAEQLGYKSKTVFIGHNHSSTLLSHGKDSVEEATFTLSDYFLGAIFQAYTRAKETNSVIKLSGLWRPIYFFPDTNEVYVDLSDSQLRAICITTLENSQSDSSIPQAIKIEETRREWVLKHCHKANRFRCVDSFLWKLALLTSRGRIPSEINTQHIVSVISWPNLTRLELTPDALKLIAYWCASPKSATDAICHLGVEKQHVFSLLSAMYVLGHINHKNKVENEDDFITGNSSSTKSAQNNSLLARVLTKLRFSW